MSNKPTSEYSSLHVAIKNDTGQWSLDTLYNNTQYVDFQWTNSNKSPYLDIDELVIDVYKITGVDGNGFNEKTKIYVADDNGIEITGLVWSPDTGIFLVTYNISSDFSYEMRVYYQYSSPHKPVRFKVVSSPEGPAQKISVPRGAKWIIYNTPVPPPPPT